MTIAAPASREVMASARWYVRVPALAWLLLLAATLRLPLAFWPNAYAPDEIYQFLEPAWRILGHDGIVSWEWRHGIRGWTLPTLLAAPVAIGHWLVPGGMGAFVAPRLVAALASLSIVASIFGFGARISRLHALAAGFVAAIWFELVFFAPHTLGEPLATAMILPAAFLLTQAVPLRGQLIGAGALLRLAFVFRFQYAPAMIVLVIGACRGHWPRLPWVISGAGIVLIVAGGIDAIHGAVPFAWLVENIRDNLLNSRAVHAYGAQPFTGYIGNLLVLWSFAVVPIVIALWLGWRRVPLLFWMALSDLGFHSLIGHKEHRFVFLSVTLLVLVAALGSVDTMLQWKWRQGRAVPLLLGAWITVSAVLATTGRYPEYWIRGTAAAQLASALRNDPDMCGVALYEVPFFMLPGRERLAGRKAIYAFDARDPGVAHGVPAATQSVQSGFNRILARQSMAASLPAGFAEGRCATFYDAPVCIYVRHGSCDAAATAFLLSDVLVRLDL